MKKRLNMDLEISTGQRKIGPPVDFTGKPAKQVISKLFHSKTSSAL